MNDTVLSYAEYRKRLKEIQTPEDAAAFARELIAPVLAERSANANQQPRNEAPASPRHYKRRSLKGTVSANAWDDVAGSETESRVIQLYAKGLTTRDIASYLKSQHGIELSQSSVSTITDKVFPLVKEWQARPLASCYPVLYLDGLHFKVRESGKIASKVAYIALGINLYGQKEVLGIWVGETEGAKFWMHVLNELKNRGVEDIFIACVDGLKGFPDAIQAIFPKADVQVCIAHQIRHTMMFVPHKDRERFCNDMKPIYSAPSEEAGRDALHEVMERWPQYAPYLKSWETRWADLSSFFDYPQPIRRMIYTTNAIESLNSQFRKVTKTTLMFPHDDALVKLLWLAQADITQAWTLPVRNWGEVMGQLAILFPDRVQF